MVAEAERQVEQVEMQHRRGLLTSEERYQRITEIWARTKDEITQEMWNNLDPFNPVFMMANSGARGNKAQLSQLAGMRGLVNDPTGRIIEIPIKANFREGLTVLEYFISTHGTRKGPRGHGYPYGRLGLPDAPARRRRAGCRRAGGRLRYDGGHHGVCAQGSERGHRRGHRAAA